jgi:hypothetical protein
MELGRVGTAVRRAHTDEDVVRGRLRVLDDNVEVAVAVEDPGLEQLVLGRPAIAPAVLVDEIRVGERRLCVSVEVLQVGVRGRGVEVEIVLLDVLTVVPLVACETKNPFF